MLPLLPAAPHDLVRARSRVSSAQRAVAARRGYSLPRAAGCNGTEPAGALRLVWRGSGSGGGGGGGVEVRRSSAASSYGGDVDASAAVPRRRYARTVRRRGLPTLEAVSFPPSSSSLPLSPLPSWQPIDCSGGAGSRGDLLLRVYDDY